ncbi:hypothetical protein J1614_002945 [Plenodomus biglobosus]|nr:hypothetical protein J1614_002945 [Plenodomus biglobosus]
MTGSLCRKQAVPHALNMIMTLKYTCRRHEAQLKLFPATPRLPGWKRQYRSITRNPRGVADEMQPKRRGGILVSSRLNDRQRSNAGARILLVVQTNLIMSGGLPSCRQTQHIVYS